VFSLKPPVLEAQKCKKLSAPIRGTACMFCAGSGGPQWGMM